MVETTAGEPVALIVLGAAHDLSGSVRRVGGGCEYIRVADAARARVRGLSDPQPPMIPLARRRARPDNPRTMKVLRLTLSLAACVPGCALLGAMAAADTRFPAWGGGPVRAVTAGFAPGR
jgi:hypothetical protein